MRYPPLTAVQMTPRQHEVAQAIEARREGGLSDPYAALLYSPDVANLLQPLLEYLRFKLRVPEKLRFMAVLMTAAKYNCADYFRHATDTRATGLSADKVEAVSVGRRPTGMTDDEDMVHAFCHELISTSRVSNVTFDKMVNRFDREICLELTTIISNTTLLTMMLNVTGTRFAEGAPAH
ncbi:hypothetical protein PX699_27010 [Sphingobium sp. H39-3-25]|uniref:hypothetical protein n=1 Tax=Sphingobium arseniciresistens TaxID=3030834 RepID=UPI0023B8ABF5|nr:hypothetical protein [Sphingobium arseniciresistens]